MLRQKRPWTLESQPANQWPAVTVTDFDYFLPPGLIAQHPMPERDQSRLMILDRAEGKSNHRHFPDMLDCLRPGDVLVLNDSKVIPARLRALNSRSGGEFEVLLLEENAPNDWWTLMRPGKRAQPGLRIIFKNRSGEPTGVRATVTETNSEGHRRLRFDGTADIAKDLDALGEVPLPPYVKRDAADNLRDDVDRYQTVYARANGSVGAPTAGLHFTEKLLDQTHARGVQVCYVTLHVGLGTFAPVKTATLAGHVMHEERFVIEDPTARLVNQARPEGRRVIAVGTTTVRVLESVAAAHQGRLVPGAGRTRIFIHPPFRFRLVDALLTNFHLPRSTLLMLVSAFAAPGEMRGRDIILGAYAEAVRQRYRFFSYGDAMLII